MDVEAYLEQHEFTCHHCEYVWPMHYEVREVADGAGGSWHFFYLTGLPAAAPSGGRRCPLCGDVTTVTRRIDRQPMTPSARERALHLV